MLKWLKLVVGMVLLPVCAGGAMALWRVLLASGGADRLWVGLGAGALCWLAIYLLLPKPMWAYVVGHELTHAVWTWACGGRVTKFRASAEGGHVMVTKSNFLIALAPYFFPFYAVLVIVLFAVGSRIWEWQPYLVWFHLLLGAAYAFHVTLTFHILKSSQSDISSQGYLFSAAVIFLGNLTVLLVAIPLLAGKVELATALRWWSECTGGLLAKLGGLLPL